MDINQPKHKPAFYIKSCYKKCMLLLMPGIMVFALGKAQNDIPRQAVSGRIVQAATGAPLAGAGIVVVSGQQEYAATSGAQGFFHLKGLPVGFYQLRIHYMGYHTVWLPITKLTTGNSPFFTVALRKRVLTIDKLITDGYRLNQAQNMMSGESPRRLSYSRIQADAALLNDPLKSLPGRTEVLTSHYRGNALRFYGASPALTRFSLEGMQLPVINHLAGIYNPSGMQSLLPADMLGTITVHSGGGPVSAGKSATGLIQAKLKHGNFKEPTFGIHMGSHASGLRFNGPLVPEKTALNMGYRYGTGHLANNAFTPPYPGNTQPKWQDIAFKASNLGAQNGLLTITGLGGTSSIHVKQGESYPFYPLTDSLYTSLQHKSRQAATGLQYSRPINKNKKVTANLYAVLNEVYVRGDSPAHENTTSAAFAQAFTRSSYHAKVAYRLAKNKYSTLATGARFNYQHLQLKDSLRQGPRQNLQEQGSINEAFWRTSIFGEFKHRLNNHLSFYLGLNMQYVHINKAAQIAPSAWVRWEPVPAHRLGLHLSRQHWMYDPANYFHQSEYMPGLYERNNQDMQMARTTYADVTHDLQTLSKLQLRSKLWFRVMEQLPAPAYPAHHAPLVQPANPYYPFFDTLAAKGYTQSEGVHLSLQQNRDDRLHYRFAAGWSHSAYAAHDRLEKDNPLGNQIHASLTMGYNRRLATNFLLKSHAGMQAWNNQPQKALDTQLSEIAQTPYYSYLLESGKMEGIHLVMHADVRLSYSQQNLSHELILEARRIQLKAIPGLPRMQDRRRVTFYPALTYKLEF